MVVEGVWLCRELDVEYYGMLVSDVWDSNITADEEMIWVGVGSGSPVLRTKTRRRGI